MLVKNYTEKEIVAGDQNVKEREYWWDKLSGELERCSFPYTNNRAGIGTRSLETVEFRFPAELSSKLIQLSQGSNHTLHIILTAALVVLLEKYTGKKDIVVVTPVYDPGVEGEFINTVMPLRNQLKDSSTFKEILMQVKKTVIEAVENQNYPIKILMNQLNNHGYDDDFFILDVGILLVNIHNKKHIREINPNMLFSFLRKEEYVHGTLEYNSLLYEKSAAERIINHFNILLHKVLFQLDMAIIDTDIVSEEEKRKLLYDFNDTEAEYPAEKTIHELFEMQAEKHPQDIAAIFEDNQITYQELNIKANQLAGILRSKGVKADRIVGLLLDRSLEMIAAILGILKAGGAYLPIEPDTPVKRVISMLEDCLSSIVLTRTTAVNKRSIAALHTYQLTRSDLLITAPRPQIIDFESIPLPDRSMVNYEEYNKSIGQASVKNCISIQATRGCPYKCVYCHKIWPKRHVFRSAENIFAEVKRYYDIGVRRFVFIDDIFNLAKKNSTRFFKLIIDNGLDVQISFPNGLRGDLLTKEYIDLMVEAGVREVALALETGSPRLQKMLKKNMNLEKLHENTRYLCEKYPLVMTRLYTMLGFPSETEEEAMMTMNFLKSLKWLHWPYVFILKIYPNTDMAKLAVEHGVDKEAIARSENLAYHELPDTLPFDRSFALQYQSDYFNNYFLSKERLLHILPYQLRFYTEDEIMQLYNSYLPVSIGSLDELLQFLDISKDELPVKKCLDDDVIYVPGLNEKLEAFSTLKKSAKDALKILMLDLSTFFSYERDLFYDVIEPPLGLMYLLTYLNQQLGDKVKGKIAKSRIDFDNYEELKALLDEFKPDIIGTRTLSYFRDFFHKTTSMIRQFGYDVPIIAGGPYATSAYEMILQDRNVDLVVLGEGEITFCELIEEIIKNDGKLPKEEVLKEIKGIVFVPKETKRMKNFGREIMILDSIYAESPGYSGVNPEHINRPGDLAYIIFTSGSTGKPKGTMIEHRNLVRLMFNDRYLFDFNDRDIWTMFHSYGFDFSVWEMYGALLYGGRLIVVPDILAFDPAEFLILLQKQEVTVLNLTPLVFYYLADEALKHPGIKLNLKYVIFGGEALKPEKLREWKDMFPGTKLINMYGITETTVHVTYKEIADREIDLNISNIGKSIPTLHSYVLGKKLELLPIGIVGELCVGGKGVGRGYLNRLGLTGEKFVKNPYIQGERLYRSGDLARLLDNGDMEYLGRIDHQVKIRGFRLEPEEIETQMRKYNGVKEAIVITREDVQENKYLCAYFTSSAEVKISELREYLSGIFPDYMIPSFFVLLDKIPLTLNGKIDRKALPAPGGILDEDYAAPRNEIEETLVKIWKNVLNMEEVGIKTSYFHMGGDSLKAISLVNLINAQLGSNLRIVDIYHNQTIEELAVKLAQHKAVDTDERYEEILEELAKLKNRLMEEKKITDDIEDIYPIMDTQKGMLFYYSKDSDTALYHDQAAYQVKYKDLDMELVKKAYALLMEKHPILRTGFWIEDSVQVVYKNIFPEVNHYDISHMEKSEQEEYINKFARRSREKRFDQSCPPLWRMAFFSLGGDNHIMIGESHHAITDGWSNASFLTELNNTYFQLKSDPGFVPAKLKNNYKEFILEQMAAKRDKEIEDYWKNELADYKRLKFPPVTEKYKLNKLMIDLGIPLRERLNKTAKTYGASLKHLCFAAYVYAMSMLTYDNDITVGVVSNNRPEIEDGDKILGCFLNSIPVRIVTPANIRWMDYIKLVDKKMVNLKKYDRLSLFEIKEIIGEKAADINPLGDTGFNYIDFHVYNQGKQMNYQFDDDEILSLDNYENTNTLLDFSVNATVGFFLAVYYSNSLLTDELAKTLCGYFEKALNKFIYEPGNILNKTGLIPEEERRKILFAFNRVEEEFPVDKTIWELFEKQVEKIPDNTAIVYENKHLTFRNLNEKSNQLSRVLRRKGVKPSDMVGITFERSLELIIGILGVLKAGGTYLPIDPSLPRKRISSMLEDCSVPVLLSNIDFLGKDFMKALQPDQLTSANAYVTQRRPQILDFDSIPIPDRSLVDYEKYNQYIGQATLKNCISLQASRGCPYKCLYCHKIWPKRHVFRSAENIFAEVQLYYNMGIRRFALIDDIFNLNKKNSMRFFELIIENGLDILFSFPNGVRGDILTKEYIDLMVNAGTREISLALETASPRLQKLIQKNLNLEKLHENTVYICEKYPHVVTRLFTMVGFPSETKEEALMTLDFIKSIKWLHYPFIFILKIYPNTDMSEFALKHGVSNEAIAKSLNLAYHELPYTLPFEKSFALKYQTDFLNDYFLSKERLLHVLPHHLRFYTEDEIVQQYNGYLPNDIHTFEELMEVFGITTDELGVESCLDEDSMYTPDLNQKMKEYFQPKEREVDENALKILLLDLSLLFSTEKDRFADIIEPPLGLMYLLTYLNQQYGSKINGKIAKSKMDFDNYVNLKALLDKFKPDVIGIRTLSIYRNFFHEAVAMIRQWGIDVPIITGGPYATSSFKTILQDDKIDLVVLGEGEITFSEVIGKMIETGGKLPDEEVLKEIPGIAYVPGNIKSSKILDRKIIKWDTLTRLLSKESGNNPGYVSQPDDTAYIIFTSGSTGNPKAIPITHRNFSPLIHWGYKHLRLSPDDRVIQNLSYFFDWSVWEIFVALTSGARLYMVDNEVLLNPSEYIDFMGKNRITVLHITPTQYQSLAGSGKKMETLRCLCIGAEKLTYDLVKKSYDLVSEDCRIFNMYGPTEATIISAILEIDRLNDKKYRGISSIPIGRPVGNTNLLVLDKNMDICPIHVGGELYISGDGVACGYLNDAGKTSESFVENIFESKGIKGARLYKTGDLARWLQDGEMEFLGRIDYQVKIRGFRIELEEIESHLQKHDGIKEAIAMAFEDGVGDKFLCAYLVPVDSRKHFLEISGLREYLSTKLPHYMIPTYFMMLEEIPLSPNGKVERKALPHPVANKTGIEVIVPRDEVEKKITKIWSEVLEIDENSISIDDDFFEAGGHSLKVNILAARINKQFNVNIALAEIFRLTTIKELAAYIKAAAEDRYASIEPGEKKDYYVLSSAQKRLYILHRMEPESTAYNMPGVIPLLGKPDIEKLETTLLQLYHRHESFRTSFHLITDEPVQKIYDDVEFKIEYYDLVETGDEIHNSTFIIQNSFVRPFDLTKAPLLRAGLIKPGEGDHEYILIIDMHHIISDGVSHQVLVKDFFALYGGKEPQSLRIQYKDFSEWQNSQEQKEKIKNQEAYWLKEFEGDIPVLSLPADYPRPLIQRFEGNAVSFEIGEKNNRALRNCAQQEGVTLYMLLLAIINILLSKISNQEDIIIGTPIAGRRHADLEQIIGVFLNTLSMRNYPEGEKTFQEFLATVKGRTLEAFENQDCPFEDIVDKAAVNRDASRNPLFDVMFAMPHVAIEVEPGEMSAVLAAGEEKTTEPTPTLAPKDQDYKIRTSRFDMTITAVEVGENIRLTWTYSTRLFKRKTIERFIGYFKKIVSAVLKNIVIKIAEIEILSEEEKNIIAKVNQTHKTFPNKKKTISQLFSIQSQLTPDNIAVIENGQEMTYRKLDIQSNKIAHLLVELGVGSNELIAIYADRSINLVAGILGILNSGGAYVPIDPAYPPKRIQYIFEDTACRILITETSKLESLKDHIPESVKIIICLDKTSFQLPGIDIYQYRDIQAQKDTLSHTAADEKNFAYVIYTSGSTGNPKGVMITHQAISNTLLWLEGLFGLSQNAIIAQKTSASFTDSVWEFFWPLITGSKLSIFSDAQVKDLQQFSNKLRKDKITVTQFVPALMKSFLTYIKDNGKENPLPLPDLKWVFNGGEAITVDLVNQWYEIYPDAKIANIYGMTESAIYASYYLIEEKPGADQIRIPIGQPIANTKMYILNLNGHICPINVQGEICIGGISISKGYWGKTSLTENAFIKHQTTGELLYRTGDIGLLDFDGNFQYIGRLDNQVQVRGNRVELGEIERQLIKHEKIKESVVLAREEKYGDKYLCAYIISDRKFPLSELREYLSKFLPDYMIPSYFIALEKIPLTPNGKIDRKALPKPELRGGESYVAPRNEIEKKLAALWSNVLDIEKDVISIDSSFFQLGGHSLKAMNLAAKMHKEFDVRVPLVEIFKAPRIKALAEYLKGKSREAYMSIDVVEKKEYYSLSSAQKRLYLLQQMELTSTAYNIPGFIPFEVEPDLTKIEETFKKLINRHENFRTCFYMVKDEPVQGIHDEVEFGIEYCELRRTQFKVEGEKTPLLKGGPPTQEEAGCVSTTIKNFVRPFDLSQTPLLRVGWVTDGDRSRMLLVDMHHIISDGVSHEILVKDFMRSYEGEKLPPLRVQYKDFSQWQNSEREQVKIKSQEKYWLKEFEGEIPVLELPTDYPRPTLQSFAGSRTRFEISADEAGMLKEIALSKGSTMFMVLLAIFNILLSKLSNQEDIIVGTPIVGRQHADLEKIIGMFVNTLVLRNSPVGEQTFLEFLKGVKERTLDAFENQEYQFEDLVESVGVNRDVSRNPLFDVMFLLQNMKFETGGQSNDATDIPTGTQAERVSSPDKNENIPDTSKFDLTLSAVEADRKLVFSFQYCTKLFKRKTIERFISYFKKLASSIAANPGKKLSQIEIISEEERNQVLYDFNNTVCKYPENKTLHQLFEEQVESTPDYIAVIDNDRQLTYKGLNEQSDRLAILLIEKGVRADSIVSILVERSLEMIIGIFGILKAGGAYLPIDLDYPEERIRYMLADSGARVLVTSHFLSKKFEKLLIVNCQLLMVNEIQPNRRRLNNPPKEANSINNYQLTINNLQLEQVNLAYIIYTSGSTGKPKGVLVQHRSVVNILSGLQKDYPLGEKDAYLFKTSYVFDVSISEIFGWFLGGGRLVILQPGGEKNPGEIVEKIHRENITHINFVPSMFNTFIDVLEPGDIVKLSGLKYIILAGEALLPELVNKSRKLASATGIKMENLYGPTEGTIYASGYSLSMWEGRGSIPMGKPVQNVMLYILNRYSKIQPVGVSGELCLGGVCLAKGYLNNPELTAEKFLTVFYMSNMSYRAYISKKIYKTGDWARWLPGGNIEFLGRIDHQVKIRGYRIELGEIENCLLTHREIKEVVVSSREDKNGDRYICAYIVSQREFILPELREFLSKELPDYMIPSYFVALEKIPLTPNGKIDRRALPKPELKGEKSYVAPRNEIERKLVELWSNVLEIEKDVISIDSNFFQLGGHSLKAMILAAKMHKKFDVRVPLVEIFKAPRINALAEYIKGKNRDLYMSIEPLEKKEYYPLSSAQKRLYILQQLELDNTAYNMPYYFSLSDDTDIKQLEQTFMKLVQRHESLRTSFLMINEEPAQRIHHEVKFEIEYHIVKRKAQSAEPKEGRHALNAVGYANTIKNFTRPFDLSQAPLLRVLVVQAEGEPFPRTLFLDMHHIITDGTSQILLKKEFTSLYNRETLTPLRLHYKDFSQWQNREGQQKLLKHQQQYWQLLFSHELPVLSLPIDYPRPLMQRFEGSSVEFVLSKQETRILKEVAKQADATLYMAILAVYTIFLYKLSGQEDIIVGTPIAARRHADLESIIGMFVNTLALRNYPSDDKTFDHYLKEVREVTLAAYENQEYPFEDLVEKVSVKRDTSRNPIFDVMLNLLNQEDYTGKMPEINEKEEYENEYQHQSGTSKFDLNLTAVEMGTRLFFIFEYSTALFKPATIERFIGYFRNILQVISLNPGIPLSKIDIITTKEKEQVLQISRGIVEENDETQTIHHLFQEQVARTPEQVAAVFHDEKLTYKELAHRSDKLAGLLSQKGVKPDNLVGLMAERSLEMLIGILGILEAGGACLPIDVEYPQKRKTYMLQESSVRLVLTNYDSENQLSDIPGEIEVIDLRDDDIYHPGDKKLRENISRSSDLLYVIYTSGSTGKPKGVMLEHKNLVNLMRFQHKYTNIDCNKMLQFTTISFDVSFQEIFSVLLSSGMLYLIDKEARVNIPALLQLAARNEIKTLSLPMSFLKLLFREADHIELIPPCITHIVTAGEQVVINDHFRNYLKSKGVCLHNHYGPSEAHVVTALTLNPTEEIPELPSIGKPISNTSIYIADKTLHLLPLGVAGELFIGGIQVGRGYLDQPELTAEKFKRAVIAHSSFVISSSLKTNDKLSKATNDRLYRTGDLARWRADGNIEFLGRIDLQLKIRGFRVELGEIEGRLLNLPEIKEAVVLARPDKNFDKYLCAYIVPDKELPISEVREYLSNFLPDFMIPVYFEFLSKLPLTPSGKIDRKALPAPQVKSGKEYIAPRNEIEKKLAAIWSEVLEIDKNILGIDADFFELGGHSLKATILTSKIKKEFNVRVSLSEVFQRPTVKLLGQYIESAEKEISPEEADNSVLLKKGVTQKNNLFLIHDATGDVEGYWEFCQHLKANFNYWGIRGDRTANNAPRNLSIEEVARKYVEEIKKIQSREPYFIAGWSLGGTIAFEMVRQLEQMGKKITFLALIDSPAPRESLNEDVQKFTLESEKNFIRKYIPDRELETGLENMTDINEIWPFIINYLKANSSAVKTVKKALMEFEAHVGFASHQWEVRRLIRYLNTGRSFHNARALYIPDGRIHTPIYYFSASQSKGIGEGWYDYCSKPVNFFEISGDHFSIFKNPQVPKFAEIFSNIIKDLI